MIKIWVRTSFSWKYKFNFDAIYSVYTEENVIPIFHINRIFGNPCFWPKNRVFNLKMDVFGPKKFFLLVLLVLWNSDYLILTQYGKYLNTKYRKKRVQNFSKIRKSDYSDFCRPLLNIEQNEYWATFGRSYKIIFLR